jgi:hypothetical protein
MMKNIKLVGLTLFLFFLGWQASIAQCSHKKFLNNCAGLLQDYQFITAYKVNAETMQQRDTTKLLFTYEMKAGNKYKLMICNGQPDNRMIVKLYNDKQQFITTNVDSVNHEYQSALHFNCTASGTYHIAFSFEEYRPDNELCGLGILGYRTD